MSNCRAGSFIPPGPGVGGLIEPGCLVRLCVEREDRRYGERFWVRVVKVGERGFEGVVDNNLIGSRWHGLRLDDLIEFGAEHIHDVWRFPQDQDRPTGHRLSLLKPSSVEARNY